MIYLCLYLSTCLLRAYLTYPTDLPISPYLSYVSIVSTVDIIYLAPSLPLPCSFLPPRLPDPVRIFGMERATKSELTQMLPLGVSVSLRAEEHYPRGD
jgi:hypothetical protein